MSDCKAVAYFGPLQCSDDAHFNFFVRDWLFLSKNRICSLRVKQRTNCSEPRHSSHDVWRFVLILRVTVVALLWVLYLPCCSACQTGVPSKIALKFTILDYISAMFVDIFWLQLKCVFWRRLCRFILYAPLVCHAWLKPLQPPSDVWLHSDNALRWGYTFVQCLAASWETQCVGMLSLFWWKRLCCYM